MPFFSRFPSAIHPATEDCKRKNPSKEHFERPIVLKEEMAWLLPVQGSEHVARQPAVARRRRSGILRGSYLQGWTMAALRQSRLPPDRRLPRPLRWPRRCKAPPPSVAQSRTARQRAFLRAGLPGHHAPSVTPASVLRPASSRPNKTPGPPKLRKTLRAAKDTSLAAT